MAIAMHPSNMRLDTKLSLKKTSWILISSLRASPWSMSPTKMLTSYQQISKWYVTKSKRPYQNIFIVCMPNIIKTRLFQFQGCATRWTKRQTHYVYKLLANQQQTKETVRRLSVEITMLCFQQGHMDSKFTTHLQNSQVKWENLSNDKKMADCLEEFKGQHIF